MSVVDSKTSFSRRSRRSFAAKRVEKINFSQQHCQFSSVFRSVFEIFIESTLIFYISTLFLIIKTTSSRYNAFVFVYLFTTAFKVVEISFANTCVSAIFEQIKLFQRLRRRKKLEVRLIKVLASSRRISFVDNSFAFQIKLIKIKKIISFLLFQLLSDTS